ncbi:MarR family transcriptional regulator [Kitasatospora herbaricolor]|uniref:MarR family winged helix-turn-helix transcriptional regulator n=1 Tax=Kitasatospora herbaricolor TaxID=68217 RepID=UPI00174A8EF1|nr:MarR family transcriptional regulator [Kitasatospora herbaricolor]MDQ0305992.1 DNA-binding MarR family transcriptional regulator [Kitasatospora herbaricolor]GGV24017.1 MarR family transcriptional regulator [Kitasatospora herbaricolor]
MKDVHNSEGLAHDLDGSLYDLGVRASMRVFAAGDDTGALEAAAALRAASQAIDRLRAQGAGGRGLSAGALDVLARLSAAGEEEQLSAAGEEKGLSIGELARAAGVSSRNVTGLVDTLERDGLARRVQDRHDRRSVRVRITVAGQDWLAAFRQPTQRAMSAVFQGFTEADLARLRHLCLRLVENQHRIEEYLGAGRPDRPAP